MSLFRNSVIVGGATFIVGSVLMEINVKQDGEPVGWWPYAGTFIAGALGFYLLGATNVVKVKNAETFYENDYNCDKCGEVRNIDFVRVCSKCSMSFCDTCSSGGGPDKDFTCGEGWKEGEDEDTCSDCRLECEGCFECAWWRAYNGGEGEAIKPCPRIQREMGYDAESTGCYECGQDYEGDDDFRNCDLCDVLLCGGCNRGCEGCSNTVCNSHRCSKDCCDGAFCDECHKEEFGAESFSADQNEDLSGIKQFMAEVFEADRKARRRTTLTWARGIEPEFRQGDMFISPHPYDNDQYYYDSQYSNDNAYHIKGLPTGFHIHLWKAPKRGRYWQAYLKSPMYNGWHEEYSISKRALMKDVLKWYNEAISTPEEKAVSPIQQLMISQGMISGDVQIHRIDTPATIQNRTDKATGEKRKIEILPANIKYYFLGGEDALAPTLFATFEDNSLEFSNTHLIPEIVTNFCRGLIFIRVESAGSVRSVNRYNSDRKQWVSSHPAWFQNMCAQEINFVQTSIGTWGSYDINEVEFLRFYGTRELPGDNLLPATDSGLKCQVFQIAQYDEDGNQQWQEPRPSTQLKMYKEVMSKYTADQKPSTKVIQNGVFNLCVAKYQPQQYLNINNSMTDTDLYDNTLGFGIFGRFVEAGQLMCRRFKKKVN